MITNTGKSLLLAAFLVAFVSGVTVIQQVLDSQITVEPPTVPFVFTASGDYGYTNDADRTFRNILGTGAAFHIALGDFSYSTAGDETNWCNFVKERVGQDFPFELISGNHDDGSDGHIDYFRQCLPDRLGSTGDYGKQFYFDYPPSSPLLRAILITPDIFTADPTFVSSAIDDARSKGIPWIIVGMHKVCIEPTGDKPCDVGESLFNLFLQKKVDIVLQAHAHTYSRSTQLALSVACPSVSDASFDPDCVLDDGADDKFTKGVGTLVVTQGIGGRSIRTRGDGSDPDFQYFHKIMGGDGCWPSGVSCPSDPFGSIKYVVSAGGIMAQTVLNGGQVFDTFTIGLGGESRVTGTGSADDHAGVPPHQCSSEPCFDRAIRRVMENVLIISRRAQGSER